MVASAVGSEVFVGLALLFLSLVAILILRYYLPLRSTPAYLLVPVFFALWLPASIALLVPVDLASSARTDDIASRGIWLPEPVLRVFWRITYWLTFGLTWLILPILAEYSDSGYRDPKDRILYSLRQNAQYHLMVFGSAIAGLVYVFVTYGVHANSLKSLVMALAYCWGLVLAIYLMGHGLVAIPRRLLRTATPSRRLRRLQTLAPRTYERLEEAEMDLEDVELQVAELGRRKTGTALDFREWIEDINDAANVPDAHPRPGAAASAPSDTRSVPIVITKKYMAEITRRFVRARHARSRYLNEWNQLLQKYVETQAILNSARTKKLEFGHSSPSQLPSARPSFLNRLGDFWDHLTLFTPYTRHIFYYHLVPYTRIVLGAILALASVLIVWSELIKAALPAASVVRLTVVHHWTGDKGQVGFAGQVIATGWILYMSTAALISITEVKVWRGRALVKRNTAHESAFWYASQVARLSIPLSYNFMTFLSAQVYKKTVFYDFLGSYINLTPLGKWFDYLFPAFILIPVLATLFGLYGKVRRLLGYGNLLDDDEEGDDGSGSLRGYGTGSWREGRDLIEREINGTSIRQRREAAAGGNGSSSSHGRREPIMVVPGAPDDASDIEGGGQSSTTPFAVSPSNSGLLPPRGGARTLGAGGRRAAGGAGAGGSSSRAARYSDNPRRRDGGDSTEGRDFYEDEDDNFFQSLGHRMKNTIDAIETPKWFSDIGQGFKTPKWMGNNENGGGRGQPFASSSAAPPDNGIRRWFGGNSDGRIRL